MQQVVNSPLPPCKQSVLKTFLISKGWILNTTLSTADVEIWEDVTKFYYVELYTEVDPIPYHIISIMVEGQMGLGINSIPFYAKQIAQRFPEG
jgi:hypothetical protein